MGKDSAALIELGRSFHQMETVNEKVSESDFVPLWDCTVMRRSLAERKLLEGIYSGYGKYSDPLKFFTLCYIAAIC